MSDIAREVFDEAVNAATLAITLTALMRNNKPWGGAALDGLTILTEAIEKIEERNSRDRDNL